MKKLKNVVVGVDFSDSSDSALREAARIAKWEGANLIAAHVLDGAVFSGVTQHVILQRERVTNMAFNHLAANLDTVLGKNHGARAEFVIGHPFRELLNFAEHHEADLLVLGAHGMDHVGRNRIGSLAGKCVRKCPIDVLLVRERQDQPFRNVVSCIDFSENSKKAARHATHVAQQDGSALQFLHIYQPLAPYIAASPDYLAGACPSLAPEHDAKAVADLEQALVELAGELVAEAGGHGHTTTILQGFDLRATIIDHLKEVGADLVVLGARGKTNIRNLLIGTTAEKIIESASCSTLAVKPDGFDFSLD